MSINYENDLFDVEVILSKILLSSAVLKDYKDDLQKFNIHRPLTRSERKIVCNTLMDYAVKNKILLRRGDFPKITEKIQHIFKKEPAYLYYRPPNKTSKRINEPNVLCDANSKEESSSSAKNLGGNKKKVLGNVGPSGQLYTSYRYRISRKREELKKTKQSTDAYYR